MAQVRCSICFLLTTILSGLFFFWLSYSASRARQRPLLIVISIDAFRHDFIHRPESKSLRSLAKDGVYGAMIPQFPSFTFTNHYSLVTGLYPRDHGMVANRFYDTGSASKFIQADRAIRMQPKWWLAEPIWITANEHGIKTATVFWPSDEIWTHPLNKHLPYNRNFPNLDRITQMFQWIDEDPEMAMVMLYFSLIDDAGHRFGPESIEMSQALAQLDGYIARILRELKARDLLSSANIVVVSDHGQIQANPKHSNIYIDFYLPDLESKLLWMDYNVVTTLFTLPGCTMEQEVFDEITEAIQVNQLPMTIMWTRDLPSHLHYQPNNRIGPLVILTEPGYTLAPIGGRSWSGFHGYDPNLDEMRAFFMARGPAIQGIGRYEQPIQSLDIYPLLAQLLGITPRPHNGTNYLIENLIVSLVK